MGVDAHPNRLALPARKDFFGSDQVDLCGKGRPVLFGITNGIQGPSGFPQFDEQVRGLKHCSVCRGRGWKSALEGPEGDGARMG
jgi:hypothetical protein